MTAPTVVVDRAALEAVLDPARVHHGCYVAAVRHLRDRLATPADPVPAQPLPVDAWRYLAGPLSWWLGIDSHPGLTPAGRASIDGVQSELRTTFTLSERDVTDPATLHAALLAVAYLRVTAQRNASMGRCSIDDAAAVIDATNGVGVALTRWVPEEGRPS